MQVKFRKNILERLAEESHKMKREGKDHLLDCIKLDHNESKEFVRAVNSTANADNNRITNRDIGATYMGMRILFTLKEEGSADG